MKTIRRFFSAIIIITLIFLINVNIYANDVTEVGGARYYVEESTENILSKGIIHHTDIAFSSAKECSSTAAGYGDSEPFVSDKYYPQQVNVLEIPSSENIKITPWANINPSGWTLSTVRSMIKDFETDNPGYKVIAAINGDFFDISGTNNFPYTPNGVHVSDGNFYKSSATRTVGFKNDGSNKPLIGNKSFTKTSNMILALFNENDEVIKEYVIDKVNEVPNEGEIAIYYANRDNTKKAVPVNVEDGYIVGNAEFALPHSESDFYGLGVISEKGNKTIGDGQFAIVSKNSEVTSTLKVGLKIRAQYEFTGEFENIQDAIGVGETLLYDGNFTGADKDRHPRTFLGVKEDGTIIMTVVDGRQSGKGMYGATAAEMAAILSHYGAVDGYNLDGGGSSTMIIIKDGELQVVNSPSDGRERNDANCLIIAAKVPAIDYEFTNITENSITVNANVLDKNGFDFDTLYVGLGDEIKEVVDGKATFTDLNRNQKYVATFYQKIGDEFDDFAFKDYVYTSKLYPEVTFANLKFNNKTLVMEVEFNDPDGAIIKCIAYIDKKNAGVNKSIANFYNFNDQINNIKLVVTYNLNDGLGDKDVVVTDVDMSCSIDVFMHMAIFDINQKISNIYK